VFMLGYVIRKTQLSLLISLGLTSIIIVRSGYKNIGFKCKGDCFPGGSPSHCSELILEE
jgi:hypothetical protein